MAKSRHHASELEQLRQENKILKSENRHLKKELAKTSRWQSHLEDLEEIVKDNEESIKVTFAKEENCPKCGSKVNVSDLGGIRILFKCSNNLCKYHKAEKKK